jgi:hypothetical protein
LRPVFGDLPIVELVGYARLVQRYGLPALPLRTVSRIATKARGRRIQRIGDQLIQEFQPSYRPEDSLIGDLQFALRYEGLNLEVLSLLFERVGSESIRDLNAEQPEFALARRLGHLFEWLTGQELDFPSHWSISAKARYVPVLDESLQFGFTSKASPRNTKYRIIDNLPGNRDFCPLVTKTPYLIEMVSKNLRQRTLQTLAKYDPGLVRRAASFLYLKETHSSFELERERPSADKARRFADLLGEAEIGKPISEDRFIELQNTVMDPRFREVSYRTQQNWIGDDFGYRKRIEFVPPRPTDVRQLMDGLVQFAERLRAKPDAIDPVIAASALSFGFVFIHPFMDGNGRLHRYLIHEALSVAGFTPKGIILPVSAVILLSLDKYKAALTSFSRPVNERTSYDPIVPTAPATGNDPVYFRYFDATEQASFLYQAIERTVEHDLDQEIAFLLGFDRAHQALNALMDWPAHSMDLFIRVVHQNGNRLSSNKRKAHFEWMKDEEVARFEQIVAESFSSAQIAEDGSPQP